MKHVLIILTLLLSACGGKPPTYPCLGKIHAGDVLALNNGDRLSVKYVSRNGQWIGYISRGEQDDIQCRHLLPMLERIE